MKVKIKEAVRSCLVDLKECHFDWRAKFELCDNGSMSYQLYVPRVSTNEPIQHFGDVENGVAFTEYTISKDCTLKSLIDTIYSDYQKMVKEY